MVCGDDMNSHAQTVTKNMVTTALELPGYQITENLGIVRGIVVRTNNIVGSLFGGLQSIFGGNIGVFRDMCDKARGDAYGEMVDHAIERGANAVIMMRYESTELQPGVTEVLAYGTAVKVVPK
jgi:uncharacterized protein YbjQ (UPF0145 family)